jgi:hypothetical protein
MPLTLRVPVPGKNLRCAAALLLLAFAVGCKTQEDAAAAASQMVSTAQTMSAYYDALDQVVVRTEDCYQAQSALLGVAPADLKDTLAQIQMRSEMAGDVAQLAAIFQKLTGSTASGDASDAAVKLNTELVTVKALSSNSIEAEAVKDVVKNIVALIQQHKEIEAAKKMAPLSAALSKFFDSEAPVYDSLNTVYLDTAKSVAHSLIKRNQVDSTAVFASALKPFDLTPAIDSADLKKGMSVYLDAQVDSKYTTDLAASKKATSGLSDALKEMNKRIDLVENEKPMHARLPPITLADVNKWISILTK